MVPIVAAADLLLLLSTSRKFVTRIRPVLVDSPRITAGTDASFFLEFMDSLGEQTLELLGLGADASAITLVESSVIALAAAPMQLRSPRPLPETCSCMVCEIAFLPRSRSLY